MPRFPRFRCLPCATAALVALLVAGLLARPAAAHGRFPQSGLVLVDPSDANRVIVRTTYGLITSDNGGARWDWVCTEAVGYNGDNEDPAALITADSSVLVGVFDGLSTTKDGCGWSFLGGELAGKFFVDITGDPAGQNVVALSANGVAASTFDVNLWESSDAGTSFAHLGTSPPSDFLALTVGVAASDPNRIYLSGRDGMVAIEGALMRSDDRGMTWQRKAVPGAGESLPFIGAVHPSDPDRLFVGVATETAGEITHFELLHSSDGGDTFTTIFQRDNGVPGFALSPDGSKVAVGSDPDGLWIAPTDTFAFEQVNAIRIRCITWVDDVIYACSDQFVNDFAVGKSLDEGKTFEPLMLLSSPCGPPPACQLGTTVGDECIPRWPQEKNELAAEDCDAPPTTSSGGALPPSSNGDCSCRVPGGDGRRGALAALFAIAGLALGLARRRRTR